MTTLVLDPANRSAGSPAFDGVLREPRPNAAAFGPRPDVTVPAARAIVVETWKYDGNISWYGPGLWGNGGACGMFGSDGLTPEDVGIAHRTLPCGTKVTPVQRPDRGHQVKDRGPYVDGRTDMTRGLCDLLRHCFTGGGVYYKIG